MSNYSILDTKCTKQQRLNYRKLICWQTNQNITENVPRCSWNIFIKKKIKKITILRLFSHISANKQEEFTGCHWHSHNKTDYQTFYYRTNRNGRRNPGHCRQFSACHKWLLYIAEQNKAWHDWSEAETDAVWSCLGAQTKMKYKLT